MNSTSEPFGPLGGNAVKTKGIKYAIGGAEQVRVQTEQNEV